MLTFYQKKNANKNVAFLNVLSVIYKQMNGKKDINYIPLFILHMLGGEGGG